LLISLMVGGLQILKSYVIEKNERKNWSEPRLFVFHYHPNALVAPVSIIPR
jgi:hypothetical protein